MIRFGLFLSVPEITIRYGIDLAEERCQTPSAGRTGRNGVKVDDFRIDRCPASLSDQGNDVTGQGSGNQDKDGNGHITHSLSYK